MAAMRTIEHILDHQQESDKSFDITVIGAEPYGNYNRIMLSPVLAGEKKFHDIMLHKLSWYQEKGITLISGKTAIAIDREHKKVQLDDLTVCDYDQLLLATGSQPFILPISGSNLPGVMSYRTINDVETMHQVAQQYQQAVVIGAGVLGLEAAYGLHKQGMQVTVVHHQPSIMNRQLDRQAAWLLKLHLEDIGIKFYLQKKTAACEGTKRVEKVVFTDDSHIPADLVVMATGIRANTETSKGQRFRYRPWHYG